MFFFHRDRKDKKIGLFFALLFLIGVSLFLWRRTAHTTSIDEEKSKKVFEQVLFSPIPSEVSDIILITPRGEETDTYLAFQGSKETVQKMLILHPYTKVECSDMSILQPLFAPVSAPKNYERSSEWRLLQLQSPECFSSLLFNEKGIEGKLYSNTLRQNAQSEFIFDAKTNIIYFHERGI